MKQWELVFRSLANINRLKIVKMLSRGGRLNVTEISEKLKISLKGTSRHLGILKNVGVLESEGSDGHVYYSMNSGLPKEFKQVIRLFT
jgi:DNA-binding transcriptional ArsR family regulator